MKFSEYKDYGDYLSSSKICRISSVVIRTYDGSVMYDNIDEFYIKEDEFHNTYIEIGNDVYETAYVLDLKVNWDVEQLPVVSPWYFMDHGGRGW